MIQRLLTALILTIIIELIVLLALRERRGKILAAAIVVNVLTNVPLNLYVNIVGFSLSTVVIGEALVVIAEALWYWLFTKDLRQSVTYSILCNATSYSVGVLLWQIGILI